MTARRGGPPPKIGVKTGHATKAKPPEVPDAVRGPARPCPIRRAGDQADWDQFVVEWWDAAADGVAAHSVYDEWAWKALEACLYTVQAWWDMVKAGKEAEATRTYQEVRMQVRELYLTPPDRIRGQRAGEIPEKFADQPAAAAKPTSRSRARLAAVKGSA